MISKTTYFIASNTGQLTLN